MFALDDWGPGMMDGRDRGGMMDGGGAWVVMVLCLVLLVALVGVVTYLVVRASSAPASSGPLAVPPAPPAPAGPTPRDVLDHRLARGEVTPEEYSAARELLDR
jgi:uncharacterized membrane protein